MKRLIQTLIFCVCIITSISAQDIQEINNRMISIMRDSASYIFAETIHIDEEKAYNEARGLLYWNIEQWVEKVLPDLEINAVVAKNIDECCLKLSHPVANRYKVFVYVNKTDIYALLPVNSSISVEKQTKVHDDMQPDTDNIQIPTAASGTTIGHTENPLILEQVVLGLNADSLATNNSNDLICQLCSLSTLTQVKGVINDVTYRGKYYYRFFNPEYVKQNGVIIVIYQHDGIITAIMQYNKERNIFINLKTGALDTFSNYPNCEAICVLRT